MGQVKVSQFETLLRDAIEAADHPEITSVSSLSEKDPASHSRLRLDFASKREAYIMVRAVEGPGIPNHPLYELPKEAL